MNEMQWDLSQLVESTDPAYIVDRLEKMVAEASAMNERYKGKIGDLDAAGLFKLLESRDEFSLKYEGAAMYCNLLYSANSTDPVAQQLNDAMRRATLRAGQQLAFMDLELGKLLASRPEMVQAPELKEFRHMLERVLARVPHQLSEVEEKLVMTKDQNGIDAWSQLQGDWLSTRTFRITIDARRRNCHTARSSACTRTLAGRCGRRRTASCTMPWGRTRYCGPPLSARCAPTMSRCASGGNIPRC